MIPTIRRNQNWLPVLFNEFFDNDNYGKMSATAPAINVIETERDFRVELAAPGMTKNDFTIRVDQENQLIISMEKKEEHNDDKSAKYLRREFSYSHFEQTLLLPENVLVDKIEATMEHGILNVTIPKDLQVPETPKERLIEIR